MNQLLKIKHWQLFTLLFAIPFLFQMVMMGLVMKSNDPGIFISFFPISANLCAWPIFKLVLRDGCKTSSKVTRNCKNEFRQV